MNQKLVITHMPVNGRRRLVTVLYENGAAVECSLEDPERPSLAGRIYVGHVTRVLPSSGGVFVRFDGQQEGYLPKGRIRGPVFCGVKKKPEIRPEDELLVQVETDALKTKQAGLTTELRLTGKYLVAVSGFHGLNFSKKLTKEDKNRLYELLSPKESTCGMPSCEEAFVDVSSRAEQSGKIRQKDQPCGFVVRTAAVSAGENELLSEMEALSEKMRQILTFGVTRPAGTCLHTANPVWMEPFRRLNLTEPEVSVVTDDPDIHQNLTELAARQYPELAQKTRRWDGTEEYTEAFRQKVRLYEDPALKLFRLYNLSAELDAALQEKVWLKSGASLIIQQTEAFVCIDVNSSKMTRKKEQEEAFLEINREAAKEAARQIRLRQLSGTILIDFINMKSPESKALLIREMEAWMRRDPATVNVVDITPLGIMEITRQKRARSLAEQAK